MKIHVMVGAIMDADGLVLVSKRPEHVHQGGLWEFPGGKLEAGESPEQGLVRELREELGIQVHASRPLIRIHHDYGDRRVLLDVRRVEGFSGVPRGCEGQPLTWLDPDDMDPGHFPAADRPIINALRLPPLMMITDNISRAGSHVLVERVEAALKRGVRLVQLRAHGLDGPTFAGLANHVFGLCETAGARLLLNRDPCLVENCARHGLHLNARTLMRSDSRPGRPNDLIGASCHDALELARAAALGLDYALLSPVQPTASHPDAVPLGWQAFADLVDPVALPVYALGGLTEEDLPEAVARGAQGIAAIRGL